MTFAVTFVTTLVASRNRHRLAACLLHRRRTPP